MKINDFIWLEEIVDKLETKHRLLPEEVEESFCISPLFIKGPKSRVTGEPGYYCFGKTEDGRHIFSFFVLKKDQKALVISSRNMDHKERKFYEKRK